MAQQDIIKEFLVSLGFKVNENGLKKFADGLASATQKVVVLATAVEGVAAAVGAAVTKMASHMEQLYYASQRTGASVKSLQAFSYAAEQLGVSADSARGSVEGLAKFMRSTPSSENFIQSLGVATRNANGQLRDTTEIMVDLGKKFKDMPYYRARVYANALGIDEETLRGLISGMGEFSQVYLEMYKKAGVNSEEAAKQSRNFLNELRTLGTAFSLLWQKISMGLLKVLGPFVKQFRERVMDNFTRTAGQLERALTVVLRIAGFLGALGMRMVEWFVKLDDATGGWSTALTSALVAWRALNLGFMLTPIGAIITAVVALGAAILALVDDYQTWKEGGTSLIDWGQWAPSINAAMDAIGALVDAIVKIGSSIKDLALAAYEVLKPLLQFIVGYFVDSVVLSFQNLEDLLAAISKLLTGDFTGAWESMQRVVERVMDFVMEKVEALKKAWEEVTGIWDNGGKEKVKAAVSNVASSISESVSDVKDKAVKAANTIAESEPIKKATAFFQQMGWSKEQSAGLAANIQAESGGKANAVGDNGKAYGIAQWHPDRQAAFKKWLGKDIRESTYEEQLAFMHYELTEGSEKRAGDKLKQAGSAGEAGAIVSKHYERPAAVQEAAANRAKAAEAIFSSAALTPSPSQGAQLSAANSNAQITQKTEININGVSDPNAAAQATLRGQSQVNNDMIRNMKGAVVL